MTLAAHSPGGVPDAGELQVERDAERGVLVLRLHRPGSRNALSLAMLEALAAALDDAERDDSVRVVVLTGSGRGFCSGGDITVFARGESIFGPMDQPEARAATQRDLQRRTSVRLRQFAKPTVALVNGPAVGAGLALALACDLVYAAADASLRTGFVNVGLAGDFGCTWLLTNRLGPSRAMELLLFSTPLSAEEARREGLINGVLPAEDLVERGLELATQLAGLSAPAVQAIKANVARAQRATLSESSDSEVEHHVALLASPEHRAAAAAVARRISSSGTA